MGRQYTHSSAFPFLLKLSNSVMFRVPVEVQGMQLQAVVDTAAQVTLVSEEFYKSLDHAPPIRKEVVMNTAGKGMLMISLTKGLPVPKLMSITPLLSVVPFL
jgi:hypothetical protein